VTALVWFRRDLRLHDHPALRAALDAHDRVIPVFVLDDRLLHGRHASGVRTQFLLECLTELDQALRVRGSGLVIRHGNPAREVARLAEETGASEVHVSTDVTPFAKHREKDLELHGHPGLSVVDDAGAPRTQGGKPYTVFSPFHRTWEQTPRRDVLAAPRKLPPLPSRLSKGRIPSLRALGLTQDVAQPPAGGETAARERLKRFLADDVAAYADNHDALAADRTSRLSPYLHFGCISPREIEERLPTGAGPAAFRRQLCWRDFYLHVLFHHPRNTRSEFQQRYRGTIAWSRAKKPFEDWCEGRTGYPLVDAAMRQLKQEGWMHNRARLVAGSFLTKDLGIDWRRGERHFMRYLVDGDEANNNGNWQWIASVGVDPQPVFRRIYNPARQMQSHDPEGTYVRRYVPELIDVPDRYLHEPWTMPEEVQHAAGCIIGEHYPGPIIDHKQAREEALQRYRV
jgi:deoxyribodipyrimidine photo-lyase